MIRSFFSSIEKVPVFQHRSPVKALLNLRKAQLRRFSLYKHITKLKERTSHSQGRNVRQVMENVKVYIRGWLGYFGIANMKNTMQRWDEWLRRRFRVYIWKQWKVPSARIRNLIKLGIPKHYAYKWG